MTDSSTGNAPAPMEGYGAYNRSSGVQAAGLSPAVPLLEQAAGMVALAAAPTPIVIADYGASEGKNSLVPMATAIRALRRRVGPARAISVVHTDLPGNDFNTLVRTLDADPGSYLRGDPAIFASMVGRSFYQQVLPAGSVTLGWSSWSVQWLSRTPAPIPDQVQVAFSRDASIRAAYARQAAEDWRTFLCQRGRELRPGGRLVVLTMALDDDGDFGYGVVLTALYAALRSLVDDGVISDAEAGRMAIPTVGRGRSALMAPFAGDNRLADLAIEQLDVYCGEDQIWQAFQRDGDATAFGARWAAFSRASVFPTLALGLDGGNGARTAAFLDRLEAGTATRLADNPEPCNIPLASLVVVKREEN